MLKDLKSVFSQKSGLLALYRFVLCYTSMVIDFFLFVLVVSALILTDLNHFFLYHLVSHLL